MEKKNVIYVIFEKLERYYDDNDKTFILAFSRKQDAEDYAKEHDYLDYFVEEITLN